MSENLSDNYTAINSDNNVTEGSNNTASTSAGNNVTDGSNNTANASEGNNVTEGSNNTANASADNNIADSSNNTASAGNDIADSSNNTASTSTAGVNTESETSNNTPIKKEPKYKFETVDIIMLPVVFILAFLCTKYYNLNTGVATLGLGATVYIVLYVISVLVYAKLKAVKLNSESIILSILMILLAISFTVFYNYSLSIFMQIAMNFMLIYLPVTVFNKLIKSETSALILYDYINALVFIPIHNATAFWICMFSKRGKSASNTKTKYFLHIFFGLLIGTPFIMIVLFLLSSADATFKNIFDNLFNLDISVPKNIGTLIWSLPMATYLYALIYGSSIEDNSKSFNIDKFNKTMDNAASIPRLSLYTVNAVICCFYILFIGIQVIYFIDILGGSLPADFTYSEYARRGFFELLAVALINIVFIAVAKVLSVKNENNKYMHIHILLNSILTLLLISVAFAKMYLYISTYGLTTLRIIPSVFMIFLCFVFAFIIIGEFKKSFPVTKLSFYAGNILFVLLCLANIDAVVAGYNLNAYMNGNLPYYDIYDLRESDMAAMPVIYKAWKNSSDKELKDKLYFCAEGIMGYYSFDTDEPISYNYAGNKAFEIKKHMNLN
ncbi:PF13777 domain protein [Lachnoanaerobaculum saburreum F0468]|uniref:PF13777 domain protein n=1 Tax=Lachnoanaerobaculum saburreum F0468 TaxID=1095750 RepID=I0R6K6_9FIRM|nr:DUF4153 domain-containing protein [Lachnoanaerobaculum saburreum]EIC95314.1 PF13777 domain protein [Lachnoanaerobaculum saburreum F0468]